MGSSRVLKGERPRDRARKRRYHLTHAKTIVSRSKCRPSNSSSKLGKPGHHTALNSPEGREGCAFVTPPDSFSESFRQLREITGKITRRLVILLAYRYSISRQACGLRLEKLGLPEKGPWLWFENNDGITDEHVEP